MTTPERLHKSERTLICAAAQAWSCRRHRRGAPHEGPSLLRSFVADSTIHLVAINGHELARYCIFKNTALRFSEAGSTLGRYCGKRSAAHT